MATPSNIQLQKGAITPAQTEQTGTKSAVSLIDSLLTQPGLPQNTSIQPQAQNVQNNELLATPGVTGTLAAQAVSATAPTAAMGTAATTQQIGAVTPQTASQFTADVVGTAKGFSYGPAFKFEYVLLVPVKGKEIKITFDDWIFKQDNNVAINRATMKKFGFKVAELTVMFVKN